MTRGKCVECLHCQDAPKDPEGNWRGWCIFNPPVPALIIGQGPPSMIGGPPQQQTTVIAIRPPLTVQDGCGSGFEMRDKPREIPKLGKSEPLVIEDADRPTDEFDHRESDPEEEE